MYRYDYYNQFFKGRPAWVKIAVFAIAAILLLLIVIAVIRVIRKALGYNENVRIDASGIKFEEGEGSVINFDPTSWVNELNDVLSSSYWMGFGITERCDTYKRVHEQLNDNQLRVINLAYEAAFGKTIREAMRGTWDSGCMIFGSLGTDYGDLLKTRLERMDI